MSYSGNFLKANGQDCIIERTVPVTSKVSIRRSTKASRDLGIRAGYWEGLILAETKLSSGEILYIKDEITETRYIVQHTNYDPQSKEIAFFSAICNATIQHKRLVKDVDENFNPIQEWQDVNPYKPNMYCYGEIINSRMRQEMPGLLEGTIYLLQVPKSLGVKELDRIRYNEKDCQVVSIDDIGLDGVWQIQLAKDLRP